MYLKIFFLSKCGSSLATWELFPFMLCVSEDVLSELLCIGNVCSETFDLHGLILHVSEDHLSVLLCIGNVCMETSVLHELILCVSEGFLCR